MKKRVLSVFLVLCFVLTLLPTAFADSSTSGKCGDNLTWTLDGDGTLTTSGTGKMWDSDYYNDYDVPWADFLASIEKVVISKGVTSIGNEAFKWCERLTNVTIPDSITSIGNSAFYDCSSLTSVTIPDSVTSIGEWAFYGCSSLTSVTIPHGVTSIGGAAFWGCSSLTSVTIGNSVTSIGEWAFSDCSSLTSITIPNSVSKISYGTFECCENLKSVTIPTSVKSIDGRAFSLCDSLSDIYYKGTASQWKAVKVEAFNNPLKNATIHYVPNVPALSITTSAGKPKIYWNAVDGAAKYWVYRSTDGKKFSYYDSTTKTSYTNNSTSIGTTYYYKVKAVAVVDGKDYASDYSVIRSIQCKPAAPSVSINRSNGKPKLSWKAVSGAAKYWIYRSTDGKNFSYWDSTTKTSYINSGAKKNTKYYYKVKAVCASNSNANSAQSSAVSIKATK